MNKTVKELKEWYELQESTGRLNGKALTIIEVKDVLVALTLVPTHTYPLIREHRKSCLIVEFTEISTGKVIRGDSFINVGAKSKVWPKHTDDCWVEVRENINHNYPILRRLRDSSLVVRFTGFTTGKAVENIEYGGNGKESNTWTPHTSSIWEGV